MGRGRGGKGGVRGGGRAFGHLRLTCGSVSGLGRLFSGGGLGIFGIPFSNFSTREPPSHLRQLFRSNCALLFFIHIHIMHTCNIM